MSKEEEGRHATLYLDAPTLTQPSCCVPNKEGRLRLTVTNGDGCCSKLQEEPIKGEILFSFYLSTVHQHRQGCSLSIIINPEYWYVWKLDICKRSVTVGEGQWARHSNFRHCFELGKLNQCFKNSNESKLVSTCRNYVSLLVLTFEIMFIKKQNNIDIHLMS